MANDREDREVLWRQYKIHVSLYKHYLNLLLRFNIFYYAVTGAIVSFVLTRKGIPFARHALIFPMVMSVAFGVFCFRAARLNRATRDDVVRIVKTLGLNTWPEMRVLTELLYWTGILFLMIAGGLGLLWCRGWSGIN